MSQENAPTHLGAVGHAAMKNAAAIIDSPMPTDGDVAHLAARIALQDLFHHAAAFHRSKMWNLRKEKDGSLYFCNGAHDFHQECNETRLVDAGGWPAWGSMVRDVVADQGGRPCAIRVVAHVSEEGNLSLSGPILIAAGDLRGADMGGLPNGNLT